MKQEITYLWRIKWAGKWTTTRHHISDEDVKKEHPEAICLPDTKRVTQIPQLPEEIREALRNNSTSEFLRNASIYGNQGDALPKCSTDSFANVRKRP